MLASVLAYPSCPVHDCTADRSSVPDRGVNAGDPGLDAVNPGGSVVRVNVGLIFEGMGWGLDEGSD